MALYPQFNFKVGDVICRHRNGRPLLVTAVGEKRFLYIPICSNARDERVSHKVIYAHPFRKWDPSQYPDSHYVYAKDLNQDKHSLLKDIKINWPKIEGES